MDLAVELSLANPNYIFESVKLSQSIRKQTPKTAKKMFAMSYVYSVLFKAGAIFLERLPGWGSADTLRINNRNDKHI